MAKIFAIPIAAAATDAKSLTLEFSGGQFGSLFSFLPQNNTVSPPVQKCSDPVNRMDAKLNEIVPENPNQPYEDMKEIIALVVDHRDFFETQPLFAAISSPVLLFSSSVPGPARRSSRRSSTGLAWGVCSSRRWAPSIRPVILGSTVIYSYMLAMTVFLLDFFYALADPRVKIGG